MAQEKPLQMLARLAEHSHCRCPGADKITHRLVRIIGPPDARQLIGTVQLGQHDRVAPTIDLDNAQGYDLTCRRLTVGNTGT